MATVEGTAGVVELLGRHEPALFARLVLHVLAQVPDPALVAKRLTSRELFDNAETFREYTLLLRDQFATLPADAQQQIVGFVQAGPPWDATPEDADRWRLRQLARFGDALPGYQQALYEALVGRFGPPEEDDDQFQSGEFVGPTAPADAAALVAMADEELLHMLATWAPNPDWRAPSPEGLRLELQKAVEQDPARFAVLATRFADLDPTYGRGLLAGLTNALTPQPKAPAAGGTNAGAGDTASSESDPHSTAVFDWTPVLAFGQAVLDRPRLLPGRSPTGDGGRDPGWIWCRQQLADLLAQGLRHDHMPANDGGTVLALLAQLAEDPEPDEEYERADGRDDPASMAINTVRGCAIIALMQYALWRHRHLPDGQPARLDDRVRAILEAHLDPGIEPTTAIRAVYGQFFGALTVCDPQWARDQVEKIFDRTAGPRLGAAGWEAYLRFNRPVRQTYDLLAPWYVHSVTTLSQQQAASAPAGAGPDSDADQIRNHLVQHLAHLYGHGIITLDADSPVEAFTRHAPPEPRAKFIEVPGIMLHTTTAPTPTVLDRLRQLWERRLGQLRTSPDADLGELAGFGWWFGLRQTRPGLGPRPVAGTARSRRHGQARRPRRRPTRRLPRGPACLALLIDAATDPWFVTGSRDDIRAVLTEGLHAADMTTQRRTREVINRLIARGHPAFADLLGG